MNVFTTNQASTQSSASNGIGLLFFQTPSRQLTCLFPFLKKPLPSFTVPQSSASSFTADMKTSTSSGGCRIISRCLDTGLVDIFQRKKLCAKAKISWLNLKLFLRWVVGADTAFSQEVVVLLKAKTESSASQKSATLFAATGDPILRKADSKQVSQIVRACMAVQT